MFIQMSYGEGWHTPRVEKYRNSLLSSSSSFLFFSFGTVQKLAEPLCSAAAAAAASLFIVGREEAAFFLIYTDSSSSFLALSWNVALQGAS